MKNFLKWLLGQAKAEAAAAGAVVEAAAEDYLKPAPSPIVAAKAEFDAAYQKLATLVATAEADVAAARQSMAHPAPAAPQA